MRLSVFEILCFMITYCCCVVRVEIIRNNPEEHVLELSVNRAQFSQLRNKVLLSRLRRDTEPQDPSKVNVGGKKDCVDVSALADQDQKGIGVFDWKFANETKFSISISWIGKRDGEASTMLLLATAEFGFFFSTPSQLYRSVNFGQSFEPINEAVYNTHVRRNSGIMKSPINPQKVILVSYSIPFFPTKSAIVFTKDGGQHWTKKVLPFQVTGPLVFHPHQEDWILARGVINGMAYLSTDFGVTWTFLQSYVRSIKWGARTDQIYEKEEQTILMTVSPDSHSFLTGDAQLLRSRDLGKNFKSIHVQHVYSFGLQGQFLYVSVDYNKNNNTRVMHVSKDGGDTWDPVQVPTVTPERFYSILDMSEGLIFLHVDDPGDTGRGVLYTSDADGIVFSESLRNHVYTNFEDITDFYKVASMRGTYITGRMNDDNSVTTVISFDRGGEWNTIPLKQEQCKDSRLKPGEKCSLQIHNHFSASRGVDVPMGPLSEPNAVGIIVAHGHPGSALTSRSDVWLSRDGGYNWKKVLNGPHLYSIGDHGGLIVAVPRKTTVTNYLMYSLNEGNCWFKYKFSERDFTLTGLVTEPGAKTMRFSLWGFHLPSREWRVITVDFKKLFQRVCGASDYETWVPHGEGKNNGCLLGKKVKIQRMKPEQLCFNGVDYVHQKTTEYCPCSDADMECDYGYYRIPDSTKCVRDSKKPPDLCLHGDTTELKDKMGYRRVPGDECRGGEQVVREYLDTHQRCRSASWYEYGMPADSVKQGANGKGGNSKIAIFLVIPVILIAVGVVVYFGKKYWDLGKLRPTYGYSQLSQDDEDTLGDESTFKYNPRPKGLRAYRDFDSSDDDAGIIDL